jgi:hypothetical protein
MSGEDDVPVGEQDEEEPLTEEGQRSVESSGLEGADPDEQELLAAFDRLSPQDDLRWCFDNAMRRIERPESSSSVTNVPWRGLPDDLWERGRSAKIGQRFVGDVAGVLAEILATDARAAADAAVSSVNLATWDALRYLAARVELLEGRIDPLGFETAEWPMEPPDPSEWLEAIQTWLGPSVPGEVVLVAESGEGTLVGSLQGAGRMVVGVEPRGASVWRSLDTLGPGSEAGPTVVFSDVLPYLTTVPDGGVGGVVLLGCSDRLDLVGKVRLLEQSVRTVRPGGTIVVLATDGAAWDQALSIPERDLAPGRPLHPETWSLLLRRAGAVDPRWHAAESGTLHAVVAKVGS